MHIGTPSLRAIAAGLVLLTGIAACGSKSSPASGTQSSDPLAGLTAKQIAEKARTNTLALSNYRVAGSVTQSGKVVSVDLTAVRGKGCQGTIQETGIGTIDLITVGSETWIKADTSFWRDSAHLPAPVIAKLAGKFLLLPASQSGGVDGGLCSGKIFTASHGDNRLKKGPIVTINGQRALTLIDNDKSRGYVTDSAKPVFIRITGSQGSQGSATITTSSTPVTITPPPSNEVTSLSSLG